MKKFVAIVKREYIQRVRSKMFIIMTVIGPAMLAVFTVLPGLLFSIKPGGDTRIAVVDLPAGKKLASRVRASLLRDEDDDETPDASNVASSMNSNAKDRLEKAGKRLRGNFSTEDVDVADHSLAELKQQLNARIGRDELDGDLVIPSYI